MHGADIDEISLEHAQTNVDANAKVLGGKIKLHRTPSEKDPLIPLQKLGVETLDFVMCNPPFYSSPADMASAYELKTLSPSAVCTGSTNEMICEGGDIGFISRILEESLRLREKVRWYSCMLGRLASLQIFVAKLKENGITNYAVTNLKAGRKTRRWAVAWSFGDLRPGNGVARHGEVVAAVVPMATEWTVSVGGAGDGDAAADGSVEELGEKVDAVMKELDLRWQWRASIHTGVAFARENVWSRSARRKRKFQQQQKGEKEGRGKEEVEDESSSSEDEEPVALAVKIVCGPGRVDIRWLRGTDFTLWESFCGMMKRALGAREQTTAVTTATRAAGVDRRMRTTKE
jgi:23S rRNA (adenine1618-N6)-methyltransferase